MLVPFTALRLKNARGLWLDERDGSPLQKTGQTRGQNLQRIAATYGYAVPGGSGFGAEHFSMTERIELLAEAYGGQGTAGNGGGARAGLLGDMQLKGIGCNPLAGARSPLKYSYGGLFLEHALLEVIYTFVAEAVLPFGAAAIHGIVATGLDLFFDEPAAVDWPGGASAILLRSPCLRPGHFMRAAEFEPRNPRSSVLADVLRVKRVHTQLTKLSRGHEGFEKLLFDFLGRSAKQMAVARAHRFFHGVMSPSNVSLDGRWLDMPSASIIATGSSPKLGEATPSFLQEAWLPVECADELIHTYNKYNGARLSLAPFARHYGQVWNSAYPGALLSAAGLGPALNKGQLQRCSPLIEHLRRLIEGQGAIPACDVGGRPLDGFHAALLTLYGPLLHGGQPPASEINSAVLYGELTSQYAGQASAYADWQTFVHARFLEACRRCAQGECLRNESIYRLVAATLQNPNPDVFELLALARRIIGTIWSAQKTDETVLFDLPNATLSFSHGDARYTLRTEHGGKQRFANTRELLIALGATPVAPFQALGFNFAESLEPAFSALSGVLPRRTQSI